MNYNKESVTAIATELIATGYVNDEQSDLGARPFAHDVDKLLEDLHEFGLEGEIDNGAHNRFDGAGSTFYWLSYGIDREKAKSLSQAWADANPDDGYSSQGAS